jgi:two-component system, OmpR family, alkaline phosphatase synthesis response regulator PhoP
MKRILVIEDDTDIALSVKYNLEKEGSFTVAAAHDGEEGLRQALAAPPDLVVLDLNLPGMDGLDVCRRLRSEPATRSVPIIMLTARVDESDKVVGLELGADDYIAKPFSVKELLARVRAVIRRMERSEEEPADEVLRDEPLVVDLAAHQVLLGAEEVALTRKEFDLLAALMRNRGRVLTRERLLERVWGYAYPGETRTVDVHIRRLRKKLGSPASDRIETLVGVGYRYRGPA